MATRRFIQCDVFTNIATKGNGLAVVVDGEGLSDVQMQDFAAWTNLAETTFLFQPTDQQADYKVRIFTPMREMPFAGHPTLGSCAAWLKTGHVARKAGTVVQECGVGLVEIDVSGTVPAFVAPATKVAPLPKQTLQNIVDALDLDPALVVHTAHLENGPVWDVLELRSAKDVLAIDATKINWPDFSGVSLIGPYPQGSDCDYEVRFITPSSGMIEDPITGSLNAAIARWFLHEKRLSGEIVISQGTRVNRLGRVFIRVEPGDPPRVFVGGKTQIVIEGTVEL